jgi:hypothetical protein
MDEQQGLKSGCMDTKGSPITKGGSEPRGSVFYRAKPGQSVLVYYKGRIQPRVVESVSITVTEKGKTIHYKLQGLGRSVLEKDIMLSEEEAGKYLLNRFKDKKASPQLSIEG